MSLLSTTRPGSDIRRSPEALSRLPTVHLNGQDYFVDLNLREFRSPGNHLKPAEWVRFDSPKAQELWEQCLIATCSRCGTERVEPRHAAEVRCQRCGAWVLL